MVIDFYQIFRTHWISTFEYVYKIYRQNNSFLWRKLIFKFTHTPMNRRLPLYWQQRVGAFVKSNVCESRRRSLLSTFLHSSDSEHLWFCELRLVQVVCVMQWRVAGSWLWGAITPWRNAAERYLISFLPKSLCDESGSEQFEANAGS